MTREYVTPDRRALDPQLLRTRLDDAGCTWETPRYSRVTTSTQDDARTMLAIGERPPFAAVTDEQTAGRGRLSRRWTAPPRSSVLLTVVLPLPDERVALPLAAGVTVAEALRSLVPDLRLKWPNDLVLFRSGELRKLGGMIVEVAGDHALIGIGINVDLDDAELPTPQAVSLTQLGIHCEREQVIAAVLSGFDHWVPPTMSEYRPLCCTIGARVQVELTDGGVAHGSVIDIDDNGALMLDLGGSRMEIVAGDVQHVRTA